MLEVETVDTNDFTKKFRREKIGRNESGCVMDAADASGSSADFFLEVYQSRATKVHEVTHYRTEQKTDEQQVMVQWLTFLFLNVLRFETLFSL